MNIGKGTKIVVFDDQKLSPLTNAIKTNFENLSTSKIKGGYEGDLVRLLEDSCGENDVQGEFVRHGKVFDCIINLESEI